METPEITLGEWLEELGKRTEVDGPQGFTCAELQKAMGIADRTALVKLKKWIGEGMVELAGKRAGVSIDGKRILTPVYRVVKK